MHLLTPVVPFEPVTTEWIPEEDNWISQVKFDGVRVLTYYDGSNIKLYNRKLHERTLHYPELTDITSYCEASSIILDGEIVAFVNGKPAFYQVMKRDGIRNLNRVKTLRTSIPVVYMIFDILHLNDQSLTNLPLSERQARLRDVIRPQDSVQLVDNFTDGHELYEAVRANGLEGIVMKDKHSLYAINGKDARWRKKKCFKDIIAVVGGVTVKEGTVNAFLLGLYDHDNQLHYIGKSGPGRFTQADLAQVTQFVKTIAQPTKPFQERVSAQGAVWLTPRLTLKVEFLEWTPANTLRHPTTQAFVTADPQTCRFETV